MGFILSPFKTRFYGQVLDSVPIQKCLKLSFIPNGPFYRCGLHRDGRDELWHSLPLGWPPPPLLPGLPPWQGDVLWLGLPRAAASGCQEEAG